MQFLSCFFVKKDILYLYKNDNDQVYFVNRKVKKFDYYFDKNGI